jgi:HSP20 family protein
MVTATVKRDESRGIAPVKARPEAGRIEQNVERMFEDLWARPWRSLMDFGWPRHRHLGTDLEATGPAIEISEDKNDVLVKAELPGMKKEDLEINVEERLLTIRGEKKKEEERKGEGYFYSERSYGAFERCIEIPRDVQSDKAHATFKDGVLEVRLPKTEEAKRKEVKIKVD